MPPIVTSAEIGRPAADVFAYATDPARFSDWQKGVIDGHMDSPANGTPAVGAKCVTNRRIGGASRPSTSTQHRGRAILAVGGTMFPLLGCGAIRPGLQMP
jgi:hypothetical protein